MIDKGTLNRLYWEENKSLSEIGKIFDISSSSISKYMKKYGIPGRTYLDGIKLKYAKDRISFKCEACGNNFSLKKSAVAHRTRNGGKIRYCSIKCRGIGQKGKTLKSNKKIVKNIYISRRMRGEIGECQICGYADEKRILTLHHKDGNNTNNDSSNHILLCPNCHSLEHVKMGKGNSIPIVGGFKNKEHDFRKYRICWWCGKVFLAFRPCVKGRFCSIKCKNKWMETHYKGNKNPHWKKRREIICRFCGKRFKELPSRCDKKYCSQSCATSARWKKIKSHLGSSLSCEATR